MFVGKHGQWTTICGTNVLPQKYEGKRYCTRQFYMIRKSKT